MVSAMIPINKGDATKTAWNGALTLELNVTSCD